MTRFVADNTVGKLARWMSLMGYDVEYDPRGARRLLADPAVAERSALVVGRCPTLARDPASEGRFFHVESPELIEQIRQVASAFPMDFAKTIFTRCQRCNIPLGGLLPLEEVANRLPPLVKEWRSNFHECPRCRQLYWEGTHTERIRSILCDRVGLRI
ncbi:hypothetical protein JW916_16475 [Candidatus Sumerlaeota bacterium]|nr:hypothetical protein [Candidatus Sumerlaeota bacterium]